MQPHGSPNNTTTRRAGVGRRAAIGVAFGSLVGLSTIYSATRFSVKAAPPMESYGAGGARLTDFKYLRGVNVAGAEFGNPTSQHPGNLNRSYYYPSADYLRQIATRGHKVIRLPFRWERVQPQIGGPLRESELSLIRATVRSANAAGLMVILDLHNYGRYSTTDNELILNKDISADQFADTWERLASAFSDESNVVGWGLMNEPHDVPDIPQQFYREGTAYNFAARMTGLTLSNGKIIFNSAKRNATIISTPPDRGSNTTHVVLSIKCNANRANAMRRATAVAWVLSGTSLPGVRIRVRPAYIDKSGKQHIGEYTELVGAQTQTTFFNVPALAERKVKAQQLQIEIESDNAAKHSGICVDISQLNYGHIYPKRSGWSLCSQAAVTAIRQTGDARPIYVGGDHFSNVAGWTKSNGSPWIRDALNRIVYEAHYYFAPNHSGQYPRTFRELQKAAEQEGFTNLIHRVSFELADFVGWLTKYKVSGFIGEIGWPQDDGGSSSYSDIAASIMKQLNAANLGATYWATGEHWNAQYPLQPYDVQTSGSLTPRSQATIFERYPSPRT